MSRVAQTLKAKLTILLAVVAIIAAGAGLSLYIHSKDSGQLQLITNAQHQLTQISYDGQNGVNAYRLLQRHASVKAKKYSFGYFVTSINGVAGDGPKYWIFYINGKSASVGASSYITKNSDRLTWKLQSS